MAFDRSNFAVAGCYNSGVPRRHSYKSADDAIAAINTAGYFNDVSDFVSVGDEILIVDSASAVVTAAVRSNAAGVVDIDDGTALAATDSD